MAKKKLILEANKKFDTSYEGLILGKYSYANPGPWIVKILEFVEELNAQHASTKDHIQCWVSKNEGSHVELTFKGSHDKILTAITFYLTKSEILQYFEAVVK